MNDKIFYTADGFAVKTLFLKSLTRDLRGDHLFHYFSTFGPLQSVRIHVHATHSFGFVKFEEMEAAAKVLKLKHHAIGIGGAKIEVEIADSCHQDEPTMNDELRIESTNATGTEFMDLNDDCLRQIFSHVSAMDLCSLLQWSETSKNNRLKDITNEVFARKYKSIELNKAATTVDEAEQLLTKFGSLITTLATDGINENAVVSARKIRSIIQWCSGTMKTLKLRNYKFGEGETKAMESLFGSLQQLTISRCQFEGDATDLFASCKSLDNLRVEKHLSDKEAIFQHTYSNLTRFMCENSTTLDYNFEEFILRHKKLKTIQLMSRDDHSALLPIIAENSPDLKYLAICTDGAIHPVQYETSVKSISALKMLQYLYIGYDRNALEFIKELNHLQSLRILKLDRIRFVPGIVTGLLRLKMLEDLKIRYCEGFRNFDPLAELCRLKKITIKSNEVAVVDLAHMVSRLADLDTFVLQLRQSFKIDAQMHNRIADARSKSGSAGTLDIMCNGITTHFRL